MKTIFTQKRITGVYAFLPEKCMFFDDEMRDGRSVRNQKIKKNMVYEKRYRAKSDTTVSDFFVKGLNTLVDENVIKREEIAGIVASSFSPDYFIPHLGNIVHGECGLDENVFVVDVWDACSGYLSGLMEAFLLLDQIKTPDKKVLLFTGDVVNRLPKDGNQQIYDNPPYGGDGASITIIENTSEDVSIPMIYKTEGVHADLIAFKSGAFADLFHQKNEYTGSIMADPGASFRFFQAVLPDCILELAEYADTPLDKIDGFAVIQANGLMVRKIADKLRIPYEKMPYDLVAKYGDSSSTVSALGIIELLDRNNYEKDPTFMIVSYGAGVKYGALIISVEKELKHGIYHLGL